METTIAPEEASERPAGSVRIATAGDIHCREANAEQIERAFAQLDPEVDLVLLAGDLTSHGTPEEAEILARAVRDLDVPIYTVLGNHDWHADRADEVTEVLTGAGIKVLEREADVCQVRDVEVGVVGLKGYVGGFAPSHLPDFGEPQLREVYAETTADVEALGRGLTELDTCGIRLVLLHYSPSAETLRGEPPEIFVFLGTDRLAAPILEHSPDAVFHGHAHAGSLEGRIGDVPVYNVSVPVIGADFFPLDVTCASSTGPIH